MCTSVFFVFVTLISFGVAQDELVPEVMETSTTTSSSDLICNTCECADGKVNCTSLDIRTPFAMEDWNGLKDFKPTAVDLSQNPLTTLSRLAELPIQVLNVSNCQLESIENGCFMFLESLANLDLSRNKISTTALSRRTFMTRLIPKQEPQPFTKMKTLSLAYNDIHSLPQDIFDFFPELIFLDLSGNPLAYIDQLTMAAIASLTKLWELNLSSCELESIPEGLFRRNRRLQRLDLSDNRFTTVPTVLSEAVNLVYLNFDKNPIETLDDQNSITSLTKLRELRMCRMSKLRSVAAGALGGLDSLAVLYLCNNPRLSYVDPAFLTWEDEDEAERSPLLQELYLNNNNITEINSEILDRWDQLVNGDFTNNPYVCNCSNQWMVDVLVPQLSTTPANATTASMICKKPQDLRGMSFAQLNEASKVLTCPSSENLTDSVEPETIIMLGVMIGVFVTFPIVLIVVLMWKRGYFATCRGKMSGKSYYDDEENDAF